MPEENKPTVARELPHDFALKQGNHASFEDGACLMEAVAYIAGEPHSDHPKCASPVLTRHGIGLNDRFGDDERQLLAPLIPKLVGTRADRATDLRRVYVLVDSAIRETVPMGLEAVGWQDLADKLRALPEINSEATARAARPTIIEVRDESYRRRSATYDAAATYAADAAADVVAATNVANVAAAGYAAYAAVDAADASDAADAVAAAINAATAYATAIDAAAAYAYATAVDAANKKQQRAEARRPIVVASIAAFERAIAIK